ncbi:MAG: isocitrate dehydrogenase [Candidatus Altiarchaeales archaeon HGW-Altiarchaeales-3]|nr:MAG: isocitrate dehydrogenase [Candidatus Altiarchaeales archaeon HGW-Altiarchaeales-3]
MTHNITLIPGDGIGPEIANAAKRCIESTGVKINWEIVNAGETVIEKYNTPLPGHVIESIKKNRVALKGPITTPVGRGFRSVNVTLRQTLDLYACVRPCKTYAGIKSKFCDENIDIVIFRENTEDLYAGIEFEKGTDDALKFIEFMKPYAKISEDSGVSIKPISVHATEKIVKYAYEYAIKNKRKKITAVHKANIMKYSDGLFLDTARKVAKNYSKNYPGISFEDKIVDNMCMQLVQYPSSYDILVLPNLYGDIVSDLCAGLIGGPGVAPGGNIGDEYAVFEAVHGSAPDIAGKGIANPTAMILSGVMMLRHIGEYEAAENLDRAVSEVLNEGKYLTGDLKEGNAVTTEEMADAIIGKL